MSWLVIDVVETVLLIVMRIERLVGGKGWEMGKVCEDTMNLLLHGSRRPFFNHA